MPGIKYSYKMLCTITEVSDILFIFTIEADIYFYFKWVKLRFEQRCNFFYIYYIYNLGKNFCVLQVSPSESLTELPDVQKSNMIKDFTDFYNQVPNPLYQLCFFYSIFCKTSLIFPSFISLV